MPAPCTLDFSSQPVPFLDRFVRFCDTAARESSQQPRSLERAYDGFRRILKDPRKRAILAENLRPRFTPSSDYQRGRFYCEPGIIEGLSLFWPARSQSPVHNHGSALMVFEGVISGTLCHEVYDETPRGEEGGMIPVLAKTEYLYPGHVVLFTGDMIHRISNEGPEPAITALFYLPPVTDLQNLTAWVGEREF